MGYIYPSLLTTSIVGGHVVAVVGTWTLLLLLRIVGVRGTYPAAKYAGDLHVVRRWRRVVAREVGLRYIVYGDLRREIQWIRQVYL